MMLSRFSCENLSGRNSSDFGSMWMLHNEKKTPSSGRYSTFVPSLAFASNIWTLSYCNRRWLCRTSKLASLRTLGHQFCSLHRYELQLLRDWRVNWSRARSTLGDDIVTVFVCIQVMGMILTFSHFASRNILRYCYTIGRVRKSRSLSAWRSESSTGTFSITDESDWISSRFARCLK